MKKTAISCLMLCAPIVLAGQMAAHSHEKAKLPEDRAAVKAQPDSLKIIGSETINKEQIPKSASFGAHTLTRTGTGIRQKKVKVVFIPVEVEVYRATFFVSDIAKFPKKTEGTHALDSLLSMPAFALVLDFKRNVSAKDVLSSFEAALKENNIKDSPSLTEFKTAVKEGGDVTKGQRVSLSAANGTLTCEFSKKTIHIKGDAKFIRDVFSIWLGIPADEGLKALRDMLILGK